MFLVRVSTSPPSKYNTKHGTLLSSPINLLGKKRQCQFSIGMEVGEGGDTKAYLL